MAHLMAPALLERQVTELHCRLRNALSKSQDFSGLREILLSVSIDKTPDKKSWFNFVVC